MAGHGPHTWSRLSQGAPAHCSSTWHTRAATAQGLLQTGPLCHRHTRDIIGTEKTPTPMESKYRNSHGSTLGGRVSLGRAQLTQEHMVQRSGLCLPD